MPENPHQDLSRRERQIMDAVYRLGRVAVADVLAEIPDPPSYSAVRTLMGKLEEKGHLAHEQEGPRYVYFASHPREEARDTALKRVLRTFFDGSPGRAMAAMLELEGESLDEAELADLAERIEDARRRGR